VRGGEQINVVPGEVTLDLDGRLLPNFSPEQLVSELRAITGSDAAIEIEVLSHDPGPKQPDMGLFDTLSSV
jgi:acetylornithine deacetylase/succinyl-diaminopimelate desuccinylase-like protein